MTVRRRTALVALRVVGSVVAALIAWSFWPAALGGSTRIVVVEGNSMHPTFELGELIIVSANAHPRVGDVIVFHVPRDEPAAGRQVIHRIVSVRGDGSFVTKGDNRASVDPFHVTPADVVGSPRYAVPRLGRLIGLLSTPWLVAACAGVMTSLALWPSRRCNAPSASGHG